MRRTSIRDWIVPVLGGLGAAIIVAGVFVHLAIEPQMKALENEIQEIRQDLQARAEFLGHLQQQVEYVHAKADWVLRRVDKRRVLMPVLNGDVYKIVEIEREPTELEQD